MPKSTKKSSRWGRLKSKTKDPEESGDEDTQPTPQTPIINHKQEEIEVTGNEYQLKTKGTFDANDLADLQNFLIKLSDKWFDIGVQLKVDTQRLENIRQHYTKYEDALREMLIIRLKEPLTWDMISMALKTPAVNGERILHTKVPVSFEACGEDEVVKSKPKQPLTMLYSDIQEEDEPLSVGSIQLSPAPSSPDSVDTQAPDFSPICGYEKLPIYANKDEVDHTFKVIIVGDSGVGKTSLIERFSKANPCENPLPTVGRRGEYARVIKLPNGQKAKLQIWDTAGQERSFRGIPRSFFRNADAALITFDISSKTTFDHATKDTSEKFGDFTTWVKETKLCLDDSRRTVIILVGNKNDIKKRKVAYREADQFAEINNMDYIETSSKEDNNVDQLFFLVCQSLVGGPPLLMESHRSSVRGRSGVIHVNNNDEAEARDSGCSCLKRNRSE